VDCVREAPTRREGDPPNACGAKSTIPEYYLQPCNEPNAAYRRLVPA